MDKCIQFISTDIAFYLEDFYENLPFKVDFSAIMRTLNTTTNLRRIERQPL